MLFFVVSETSVCVRRFIETMAKSCAI